MTTTVGPLIGAPSTALTWDAIDWQTADKQVRQLQMRIAKATQEENRVRRLAFERLERCDGKRSRTVLRGGSGREVTLLPDSSRSIRHLMIQVASI